MYRRSRSPYFPLRGENNSETTFNFYQNTRHNIIRSQSVVHFFDENLKSHMAWMFVSNIRRDTDWLAERLPDCQGLCSKEPVNSEQRLKSATAAAKGMRSTACRLSSKLRHTLIHGRTLRAGKITELPNYYVKGDSGSYIHISRCPIGSGVELCEANYTMNSHGWSQWLHL
jgi:hypothetical protein